jgi:hypothetical protein
MLAGAPEMATDGSVLASETVALCRLGGSGKPEEVEWAT